MHTDIDPMGEVFFALCKTVDTPVSLSAWLRYKYSHAELCDMAVRPGDYKCATAFANDYLVTSYLSKYTGLKTGIDTEAVALQKFASSEVQCRETNLRIRNRATTVQPWLGAILHSAQRKIARLLGPYSTFCVSEAYGWGPGATYDIPRRRAHVDTKMLELPITVSSSARAMLRAEIETDLRWSEVIVGHPIEGPFCLMQSVFSIQNACRITTVPKSAKTDRVIAVEPRGNGFLQKGFGGFIRDKLRRVGIDLSDQGKNQELARKARALDLATIDLKSASDTVSIELVYELLPYEWASAMDSLRSRWAEMPDGSVIRLEKFSSMGNGFTFELETLIFWAISSSINDIECRSELAVYGDDIIVHSSISQKLLLALQWCGFTMNLEKSFTEGPFYESCGRHYFEGIDVTPAYQKERLVVGDSRSAALTGIRAGNRLLRVGWRLGREAKLSITVRQSWQALRRTYGSHHRYSLPFGSEGDDGWLLPYADFPFSGVHRNRGVLCEVIAERQVQVPGHELALYAHALRLGNRGETTDCGGDVEIPIPGERKFVRSQRWVTPSWKFSVRWG